MIFTKVVSNKSIYETQIIEAKIVFICVGLSKYSVLQSYSLVQCPTQDLSVVQARTPGSALGVLHSYVTPNRPSTIQLVMSRRAG